jgi:hypothetical protein
MCMRRASPALACSPHPDSVLNRNQYQSFRSLSRRPSRDWGIALVAIRPVGHATGWRMFDALGVAVDRDHDAIRSENADLMEIDRPAVLVRSQTSA